MDKNTDNSRYFDISSTDLFAELNHIGHNIKRKGGDFVLGAAGHEIIYDFFPHNRKNLFIRIYTSVTRGNTTVRDCGEDAIRIVIGALNNHRNKFIPLNESRRIYRTAPQGTREERTNAFLNRLKDTLRETYKNTLQIPKCPVCSNPMKLRENKNTKNQFYGCVTYPTCRGTRTADGKSNLKHSGYKTGVLPD